MNVIDMVLNCRQFVNVYLFSEMLDVLFLFSNFVNVYRNFGDIFATTHEDTLCSWIHLEGICIKVFFYFCQRLVGLFSQFIWVVYRITMEKLWIVWQKAIWGNGRSILYEYCEQDKAYFKSLWDTERYHQISWFLSFRFAYLFLNQYVLILWFISLLIWILWLTPSKALDRSHNVSKFIRLSIFS